MKRSPRVVLLSAGIIAAATTLMTAQVSPRGDAPVLITVAVTNADGFPVRGLTQSDFTVVEEGQAVTVTGVRAVTEAEAAAHGRTIVLLLGGTGTAVERTTDVQAIARNFLSKASSTDRVSVVRFGKRGDELTASPADMLMRVAEFRTISSPPLYAKTRDEVLDALAQIAGDLQGEDVSRQAVVWIGASGVFDITEPALEQHDRLWPHWVKAVSAAASAGVSAYVVDPHGLTGRVRLNPDGLVAHTGGAIFDNTNNFDIPVNRIWNELGSHYVLAYTGTSTTRDRRSIEVTVSRPGVDVHAPKSR